MLPEQSQSVELQDRLITLTKKKVVQERVAELQAQGLDCDPIKVLMELAVGKAQGPDGIYRNIIAAYDEGRPVQLDPLIRVKAASELMQYMYPKLKSVEVTGKEGQAITFAVVAEEAVGPELAQLASQEINFLPRAEDEQPITLIGRVSSDGSDEPQLDVVKPQSVGTTERDRSFLRPTSATRPSEMEF